MGWHELDGSPQLRTKSKGWAKMCNNFVKEYGRFLQLSDEFEHAQEIDPAFSRQAREVLLIGENVIDTGATHICEKQPRLPCSSILDKPN